MIFTRKGEVRRCGETEKTIYDFLITAYGCGLEMGKQINYWLKYEEFLKIAQTALDCGCVIIKPDSGKRKYGQTLDIITEDKCRYYFYLPEAGTLMSQQIPFQSEQMIGYNAAGNTVIEAGFSSIYDNKKEITRSRLFVISGYYNETGEYIARPKCLTQTYQKLVRIVKRIAPYTEITDHIISTQNNDYLQEREWIHKEYISASCLKLKASMNYKLV